MGATPQEISAFKSLLYSSYSSLAKNIADRAKLNNSFDVQSDKIKLILLCAYIEIVEDYFNTEDYTSPYSYESNNFFTTIEIKDIIQHINNICKTFYNINL